MHKESKIVIEEELPNRIELEARDGCVDPNVPQIDMPFTKDAKNAATKEVAALPNAGNTAKGDNTVALS